MDLQPKEEISSMSKLPTSLVSISEAAEGSPSSVQDRLLHAIAAIKRKSTKLTPSKITAKLRHRLQRPITLTQLVSNYTYDFLRFSKESAVDGRANTQTKLRALITMDYHRIEKGLSLKEPRVRFGPAVIERLLSNLSKYQETYKLDETGLVALNALSAYCNFNREQGVNDEQLQQALTALRTTISNPECTSDRGGVIQVTRQQILEAAQLDLQSFFESRYSIRQFAPGEVEISLIEKAVVMAQKTPSVCNRQSSKVYVFSTDEDKQKVLSYQNGNRGFGDQASKVLIVTSDLQHFVSVGERNQGWIDGGMFAMSLVYALHALGLGTCCLNWSVERHADRALREAAQISNSEAIIMMIAVGHIPDELKVAQSPRKKIDEVLVVK